MQTREIKNISLEKIAVARLQQFSGKNLFTHRNSDGEKTAGLPEKAAPGND
ncbi:MAG TPA: hypothetical protein VEQ34_12335 [Pyrinomonadaceae bacterium]|nr:hypothetical protein [Pyrinomonadaceae bacterium]